MFRNKNELFDNNSFDILWLMLEEESMHKITSKKLKVMERIIENLKFIKKSYFKQNYNLTHRDIAKFKEKKTTMEKLKYFIE